MTLWSMVRCLFVRLVISCCRCSRFSISDTQHASLDVWSLRQKWTACLWTITIWLIRIWVWGSNTDDEYSRSGRTRVVQAVVLMFMGHEWRLRLMNARVRFAEAII